MHLLHPHRLSQKVKVIAPVLLGVACAFYAHATQAADTAVATAAAPLEPSGYSRLNPPITGISVAIAWSKALAANPGLKAAQHGLAATDGTVLQSKARPNPEASYSQEDTRPSTRSITMQINQRLELGGKRDARIKVAESSKGLAQAALAQAQVDLRFQVTTRFNELLLARQRLQLASEMKDLAARTQDAAQKRVTAGRVPPLEATRAQVALGNAEMELTQARSSVVIAQQDLVALWGGVASEASEVVGDFARVEAPPSVDRMQAAIENSPGMLRVQRAVEQSRAVSELERSLRVQDPTVSVGLKRAQEVGRNQIVFGVSMPLPLFDTNAGNQLEALRKLDQAEQVMQDTLLQLRVQALSALQQQTSSYQQITQLRDQVIPTAQTAYDLASRGFTLGKFNFLDVLDTQRTLVETQRQLLDQLMASHRAQAEFERILGISIPALPLNQN
ncbi:TolC family protein [Ottowia thiooxydans]|uniref:TolC family protein n=1 Tax=Ottowia thiooxydans TaxID=219182 RepID=UPI000A018A47|nr:TolC family protein [Ottowia thiooxydans]